MLSDKHIDFIAYELDKSAVTMHALKEDLLDHLCCYVEEKMEAGYSFAAAYNMALAEICPNGFEEIQQETLLMLNPKNILFMKKFIYLVGLIAAMSVSVGSVFKILHWPGGGYMATFGLLGLVFLFLPMLAADRYKMASGKMLSEKLKVVLGLASAVVIGLSVLFKTMHLQGASMLLIGGAILFTFGFLPFLFFSMYRKTSSQ